MKHQQQIATIFFRQYHILYISHVQAIRKKVLQMLKSPSEDDCNRDRSSITCRCEWFRSQCLKCSEIMKDCSYCGRHRWSRVKSQVSDLSWHNSKAREELLHPRRTEVAAHHPTVHPYTNEPLNRVTPTPGLYLPTMR